MARKPVRGGRRRKTSMQGRILLVFMMVAAIVFMPTTIILFVGMLPTMAAAMADRSRKATRAFTVGSLNLAATTPFLLDLWTSNHSADYALLLISDPWTVIVMYAGAAIGYMIDWALSGMVATMMVQTASARLRAIHREQEVLVARWGPEVSGDIALDAAGFPVEKTEKKGSRGPESRE